MDEDFPEAREVEEKPEDDKSGEEEEESGSDEAAAPEASKQQQAEEILSKKKAAKPRSMLARDEDLEAELNAQFNTGGLTRKQREELEEQERQRKEEQAIRNGESEEAKADMDRLAEIRRKREEQAAKKKEEEEKGAAKEAQATERAVAKDAEKAKHRAVAEQVAALAAKGKDGKVTLNFLNQDAACKKVLKPLCKKEGIKAINKAWLSQFPEVLKIAEEGKDLVISPKTKK